MEIQRAPVHALGEAQSRNNAGQNIRQEARRFRADAGNVGVDVAVFYDQVFYGDFLAPGKAHGGLRRIAVAVVSDFDGRPFVLRRNIGLLFRDALDEEGYAARRSDGADSFIGDVRFIQFISSQLLYLREDARHIMSRDFFGADFK